MEKSLKQLLMETCLTGFNNNGTDFHYKLERKIAVQKYGNKLSDDIMELEEMTYNDMKNVIKKKFDEGIKIERFNDIVFLMSSYDTVQSFEFDNISTTTSFWFSGSLRFNREKRSIIHLSEQHMLLEKSLTALRILSKRKAATMLEYIRELYDLDFKYLNIVIPVEQKYEFESIQKIIAETGHQTHIMTYNEFLKLDDNFNLATISADINKLEITSKFNKESLSDSSLYYYA